MKHIYMDYAAATPMSPQVLAAMKPYFSERFANPSAIYLAGRAVRRELEAARAQVARCLGARPAEIIFTSGATEANNLAIAGILQQFPDGEVLVGAIEHESVLAPARQFRHKLIPVDEHGAIILNKLSNLAGDKTVLISVGLINNELGTIQPLAEIAKLVSSIRAERLAKNNPRPLYLHTDAAQAGNYLDLHVSRLGVDLLSLNGGKIYGPKQSGALYVHAGVKLAPIIRGGGQEFGLRSGTENMAGCAGLAAALEYAQAGRAKESRRIRGLQETFEQAVIEALPTAIINGGKKRAPHITSLTIAGIDNERVMMELDERGISAAVGSACSAGSDEPSHVLGAIGLNDEMARSTLRFSYGRGLSQSDVQKAARALGGLSGI